MCLCLALGRGDRPVLLSLVPFRLSVGSREVKEDGWFLKGGDLCGIRCIFQVASLLLFSSAA